MIDSLNTQLKDELDQRLTRVDARFRAELHSDLPNVNVLASHVERFRGKMLRPTLVILSAMAWRGVVDPSKSVVQRGDGTAEEREDVAAAVVEMVHMATLVHDDILDEAAVRRGGRTINALQGNEAAVMLGDYLISHAYHLCSGLGSIPLSRLIASTTNTVCEGELLQLHSRGNLDLSIRTYFEIVARKTASLCAACCRVPAVLDPRSAAHVDLPRLTTSLHEADLDIEADMNNDTPDDSTEEAAGTGTPASCDVALSRFGRKLGIAFQIADDVLDLVGDEDTVGKTLGRDLLKGKLTLPMLYWLEELPPHERERTVQQIRELSTGPGQGGLFRVDGDRSEPDLDAMRDRVRSSAAASRSRAKAAQLLRGAVRHLEANLPGSPARDALTGLAVALAERSR